MGHDVRRLIHTHAGIRMLREVLAEDPKNSLHSLTWVCSPFSRVNMTGAIERLVLLIESKSQAYPGFNCCWELPT